MKVIKSVAIKQILTEKSRESLQQKFLNEKKRLETECDQLDFQKRKTIAKYHATDKNDIATRYDREIKRRQSKVETLTFQLDQLNLLPDGAEMPDGEMEAIEEINPGDQWDDFLKKTTIVVKDGIVVEIR